MAKKQVAVSLRKPPSPEKVDAFVAGGTDGAPGRDAGTSRPAGARSKAAADRRAHDAGPPAPVQAQREQAPGAQQASGAQQAPGAQQASGAQPAPAAQQAPGAQQAPEAQPAPAAQQAPDAQPSAELAAAPQPASAAAPPQALATTPEPPAVPPVLVGADGRARRAVTVYLPDPLADRLVLHCIEHDRDVSNLVGEAVEVHLDRRLGPATVSAAPAADSASTPREPAPAGPSYRAEPFRAADPRPKGRVGRVFQVGRVLMTLWRQRPRAS